MSSVLTAFRRSLPRPLVRHAPRLRTSLAHHRAIHVTSVVHKKKQQAAVSDKDDLFADTQDDADESLFSSGDLFTQPSRPTSSAQTSSATPRNIPPHNPSVPAPSVDNSTRFEEQCQFLHDCLVTKTEKRVPRDTALLHLFNVASTPDQLERAVELLPKWRDNRREFRASTATSLARRCHVLRCPELALRVFANRPKYGLDLTLDAARLIVHGLIQRPVQDVITFASLFSIYNLPSISSDLYFTSFVLHSLLKDGSEEAVELAQTMVPALQQLLESAEPASWSLARQAERPGDKQEKAWVASALSSVQNDLRSRGLETAWLDNWMHASGYDVMQSRIRQ